VRSGSAGRGCSTPGGDTLTIMRRFGTSQIFRLPLDGAEPVMLRRFTSGNLSSFDWIDHDRLVIVRGHPRSDAVLITNFR